MPQQDVPAAEFALTEGGGATLEDGRVTVVNIQTTEKVPRGAQLVANGTSGHGSVPRADNPIVHLAAAVAKVGAWETPLRLDDTMRLYFERLAGISPPEKAERYRALLEPQRAGAVQRYLAEHEPQFYSMLRTSIVPTILKGGFRTNVIPSEAEATLDIRALPDEDMPKLFAEMTRIIEDPASRSYRTQPTCAPLASRRASIRKCIARSSQRAYVSRRNGSANHVHIRNCTAARF
jgi:acetylornithine deacetylase/succinyl-diaminopimelate desuccinylase-like protein